MEIEVEKNAYIPREKPRNAKYKVQLMVWKYNYLMERYELSSAYIAQNIPSLPATNRDIAPL